MHKAIKLNEQYVIELYAKYDNCRQVAEALGVSNEKVRRVLKKHGVSRTGNRVVERRHHPAKCAYRDNCYALFRMLYDVLGINIQDIATTLGANKATVWNACCKSRGIRGRWKKQDFDLTQIEYEYLNGATTYELGEKYGVDHTAISKWMCQLGHKRGRRKGFILKLKRYTCVQCGKEFESYTHNAKFCSAQCKSKQKPSDYRSRCKKAGVEYDKNITLGYVFKRDNGICYICGSRCDFEDIKPIGAVGFMYPTIDHVVPLSKGGSHTNGNVKLAHWLCNSIKQDRDLSNELTESIIEYKIAACC